VREQLFTVEALTKLEHITTIERAATCCAGLPDTVRPPLANAALLSAAGKSAPAAYRALGWVELRGDQGSGSQDDCGRRGNGDGGGDWF